MKTKVVPDQVSVLLRLRSELQNKESPIDVNTISQICSSVNVRGHLAMLDGSYLSKIVAGEKTIESRFSKSRIPPFQQITADDVVFLKQSSGPIQAIALVSKVEFYGPLKPGGIDQLIEEYKEELRLDESFITLKRDSNYVTLIYFTVVLPINPIPITKSDGRSWIVLTKNSESKEGPTQLNLFATTNSDCQAGLHSYHNSKQFNLDGYPLCKYCGADLINWKRIHQRDGKDLEFLVAQLQTDVFRHEWWTKELDRKAINHALRKGLLNLRQVVLKRIQKSVGEVYEMPDGFLRPYRDGYQTPLTGNSIYYAQHALACCCRKCMYYSIPSPK